MAVKGGGIAVQDGNVDLYNVILQNNQAEKRVVLFQNKGALSLSNATLESNVATQGGGLASQTGQILTVIPTCRTILVVV